MRGNRLRGLILSDDGDREVELLPVNRKVVLIEGERTGISLANESLQGDSLCVIS